MDDEGKHDCFDYQELVSGSDGLMFYECSFCMRQLSGFIGQYGVFFTDKNEVIEKEDN